MRYDNNLLFLQHCPNEQLKTLCDILTHDETGEVRYTESLTDTDAYLECYPDNMQGMWGEIAGELQKFGGNSLANIYRCGQGVIYAEIVDDVCRKLKVDFDPSWPIVMKEGALLNKVFDTALDQMTEEEKHDFVREMKIPGKKLNRQAVVFALQLAMKQGGKFLTVAATGVLGRLLAVATGPIGWAATAVWTVADIAAPAYRVTVPAVVMIALMRVDYLNRYEEEQLQQV